MSKYRVAATVLSFVIVALLAFPADAQSGVTSSNTSPQSSPSSPSAASVSTSDPKANGAGPLVARRITGYKLSPDLYKKAHDISRIRFRLSLLGFIYGLVILWIVLHWKLGPKFRDRAEKSSRKRFVQALVFSPLLILTMAVLTLPLDIYSEVVEKQFGLSVQSWGSWSWDWVKGQLIALILFTLLIWILYAVIRRSPRRWWFYFWLVSLPILIFVFFITPWVIAPLFNKFEPLQGKDPQLTAALERMVQRSGEDIPPERMFWMNASEKSTALNAYVTGLGASKRVVILDTTIAKMSTPQIVFVAGHEMGHYVLHHVIRGLVFFSLLFLFLFYLGYRSIGWVLARWGEGWAIRGFEDWASLPALLLLLTVFSFLTNPITSAFSRHDEHQADQYGLEVTHGLTPESAQVAAQAFQALGEVDLADPDPNPLDVFLFYSHPSIGDRIQFCLTYDPWAGGESGEFVK
jgi:STE24 endopeptidase